MNSDQPFAHEDLGHGTLEGTVAVARSDSMETRRLSNGMAALISLKSIKTNRRLFQNSMPAMQNSVHEADKDPGHRLGGRPWPGAQGRASHRFGGWTLAEVGAARSARRYWRWQENQEFLRSRLRKCQEEAATRSTQRGQVQGAGVL